jgi:hypothetical protein
MQNGHTGGSRDRVGADGAARWARWTTVFERLTCPDIVSEHHVKPKLHVCLLVAVFVSAAVSETQAQARQCRVTGPTCSEAKAQCRQLRKRAFPGKSNNRCANRFRRCMAEGRYVSRNCNVPMEKAELAR